LPIDLIQPMLEIMQHRAAYTSSEYHNGAQQPLTVPPSQL